MDVECLNPESFTLCEYSILLSDPLVIVSDAHKTHKDKLKVAYVVESHQSYRPESKDFIRCMHLA